MSDLLRCPFCGAKPHQGLGKVYHCQLHGEPHQDFSVFCPHGCAEFTEVNKEQAVARWNTRSDLCNRAAAAIRSKAEGGNRT